MASWQFGDAIFGYVVRIRVPLLSKHCAKHNLSECCGGWCTTHTQRTYLRLDARDFLQNRTHLGWLVRPGGLLVSVFPSDLAPALQCYAEPPVKFKLKR